jgi:hypothetical protein
MFLRNGETETAIRVAQDLRQPRIQGLFAQTRTLELTRNVDQMENGSSHAVVSRR